MASERVLEEGKGWKILFKLDPTHYIALQFTCLACGHRISRQLRKVQIKWQHYYIAPFEAKARLHRICHCSCDEAQPPSIKEQEKARRRLQYWKRQFELHRTKFFTGEIGKMR
ncbi:hypothetical protein M1367_03515 [Candidatus Marsarchaeota archaeon]|jgi:hypothetical protein|nr:hypothetical protein [Candidatus Marsarchaeota archaeon]